MTHESDSELDECSSPDIADFSDDHVVGKRKADDDSYDDNREARLLKKNKHCRASKAKWTSDEDEILTKAVMLNGEGNWKKIAQSLNDRSHLQCLHRWQKVLNPALVKGPWREEEDLKLGDLVEKYGPKDWSTIASHIQGRIGKQCRERWFNHLSPDVRKTNWTVEEDQIIIDAHQRLGNKWTAISKLLDGRPANAIKNHWNSTLLKRIQEKNGTQVESRPRNRSKKKQDSPLKSDQELPSQDSSPLLKSASLSSPGSHPHTPQPQLHHTKIESGQPLLQQQHALGNRFQPYFSSIATTVGSTVPAGLMFERADYVPGVYLAGPVPDTLSWDYAIPMAAFGGPAFSQEFGLGLIDQSAEFMDVHHTVTSSLHPLPELQFCFDSGSSSMLSQGHGCSPISLDAQSNFMDLPAITAFPLSLDL